MPIDASIYRTQQPVQIQTPNPLDLIQAAGQVQQVRSQVEARRLAADAARQKAADDAAVQQVFAQTGGDVPAALSLLYARAPARAAVIEKEWQAANKDKVEAVGKDLENQKKQLEHYLNVWGFVKDDSSLNAIRPLFVKAFPQLDAALPTEYGDGTAVQAVSDAALTRQQQVERNQKTLELFANGKFHEALGNLLSQPDITPEKWDQGIAGFIKLGGPKEVADQFGGVGGFSPANVANAGRLAVPAAKREELAKPQPITTTDAAGNEVTQFVTPTAGATYAKPAQHSPAYKEWQDYQAQGGTLDFNAYQTMDANRKAIRINAGQGSPADVKDAVQGMIDGIIPPMLPGRASTAYTAMMAEAQRRGYNLAGAATDWVATQKHIATMNGAQQLRLNQAVNALPEMLDKVDTLAQQWKGSGAPLLNRANLALAKNGVYGTKAATIATQLESQIADVVADLGNVYMGGNSPTDHALQLAGKSLQADWSEPVLRQMITLAKENVRIRRNSINNTGVAGASADNPYMPAPPGGSPATTTGPNPFRK